MSNRPSYYIEKYTPISVCLLTLFLIIIFPTTRLWAHGAVLANAMITFFSISFGFIATSLSIMFSIQDRKFVKSLKSSGAFRQIIDYHWSAILWSLLSVFVAILFLLSDGNNVNDISNTSKTMLSAALSIGFGSACSSLRVVYFHWRIVVDDSSIS